MLETWSRQLVCQQAVSVWREDGEYLLHYLKYNTGVEVGGKDEWYTVYIIMCVCTTIEVRV